MKNVLRNLGVVVSTGVMAITGFVMGSVIFRPKNVTISDTTNDEKEKKESE